MFGIPQALPAEAPGFLLVLCLTLIFNVDEALTSKAPTTSVRALAPSSAMAAGKASRIRIDAKG